jgi:DNA-binding Lrp family transcriptional regulator
MNTPTTAMEMTGDQLASPLASVSPEVATSVLAALSDEFSERIIMDAIDQARTIEEISSRDRIPLSTCYRRVQKLVDDGLVVVDRIIITNSGKRYATYRSCFRSFRISADPHGVAVEAEINKDVREKIRNRHLAIGYGNNGW